MRTLCWTARLLGIIAGYFAFDRANAEPFKPSPISEKSLNTKGVTGD